MTPTDELAFVGSPPADNHLPEADEVHVSVAFTWDAEEAVRLAAKWQKHYPMVRIGGPAMGDSSLGFVPGRYIKPGVTFTTIGCNSRCPWCLVWRREGTLVEFEDFAEGAIIQDNNLCQASRQHIMRVFGMLERYRKKTRRYAVFQGGLDARIIARGTPDDPAKGDWIASLIKDAKVKELFLAADTKSALKPLEETVQKLEFFGRDDYGLVKKLRSYVLIGFRNETMREAEERLEAVYEIGCLPFAQLYQPPDHFIEWSKEWKRFARLWQRPAATKSMHGRIEERCPST